MPSLTMTADAATEVLAVSKAWVQAELDGDVEAVDRILAHDFHSITSSGSVMSKTEWLQILPSYHFTTLSYEDVTIRVHGSVAVLRGIVTTSATVNGKETAGTFRSTDIFLFEDNGWKAIGAQLTKLPE